MSITPCTVSLGFFDDITIPHSYLQEGSEFNAEEQVWVWMYDENEMFMDIDEDIRFRVESEQFFDTSPSVRPRKEGVDTPDLSANSSKQPPYSLVVCFPWLFGESKAGKGRGYVFTMLSVQQNANRI